MRAAFSAAVTIVAFGTVVGLPQCWQLTVMPAAAASTTYDVAQCEHAKTISLLGACTEVVEPPAGCIARIFSRRHTGISDKVCLSFAVRHEVADAGYFACHRDTFWGWQAFLSPSPRVGNQRLTPIRFAGTSAAKRIANHSRFRKGFSKYG